MKKRKETDALGTVEVPASAYWGAQTERSKKHFAIGKELMPFEVIEALCLIKKAAAIANADLGVLPSFKRDLICQAADAILEKKLDAEFPLRVWQTGSGTQTNMNVNEVISNYASKQVGKPMGSKDPLHPNDDVNCSQSSNDTFPTAMHLAALMKARAHLVPNLERLQKTLEKKATLFAKIVKVGRTHLMDATPLTFGQEFSGYAAQIKQGITAVCTAKAPLMALALGGTAVGTGLNAPYGYQKRVAEALSELTNFSLYPAPNTFAVLAGTEALLGMSSALKAVACSAFKIANDIRLMGSGPRAGLGELLLPSNEPGSSIMPGKVNPTQCEALAMVAVQVMSNDQAISFASAQGQFELNVYRPLIAQHLLQAMQLLGDSAKSFCDYCLDGLQVQKSKVAGYVETSLMLVTALNPHIGYDKAAEIAKKAYKEDKTLKQAAVELGYVREETFASLVDPMNMAHPHGERPEKNQKGV